MVIDYYIRVEKERKRPGKHLLADNVVLFSAFNTVLTNPKIIYGYLNGYVGGGNFDSSYHKVEFDSAGRMIHHYRADEGGNFFYDAVTNDSCDIPQSASEERTFTILSDAAHYWYPGYADDYYRFSVSPDYFDRFVRRDKRSRYFAVQSENPDSEAMYDLCRHVGYYWALHSPEDLYNYGNGD